MFVSGAGEGIRTLDPNLGKVIEARPTAFGADFSSLPLGPAASGAVAHYPLVRYLRSYLKEER
jgi:hypothetical protein